MPLTKAPTTAGAFIEGGSGSAAVLDCAVAAAVLTVAAAGRFGHRDRHLLMSGGHHVPGSGSGQFPAGSASVIFTRSARKALSRASSASTSSIR